MTMTPNKLPPLPERKPGVDRLWDTQWMNIVNHADCWRSFTKEDAVAQAILMTEQKMAENFAEALRQSQSLPAGAVDHATSMEGWFSAIDDADELFVNAPDQRFASRASRVVTYLKANKPNALQADAREKGEAVNYPASFKFAMQQAVENIKVPKMSPLKQELFKAGTVATINAINEALATQPAQASEKDNG